MTTTIQHNPTCDATPSWLVGGGFGTVARCHDEQDARRVAKALDLLDEMESGPQIVTPSHMAQAEIDRLIDRPMNIIRTRATVALDESEIRARAREAAIADAPEHGYVVDVEGVRSGKHDGATWIRSAARALRDLSKPLAEIVPPPVDPDLIEARKIAAPFVDGLTKDIEDGGYDSSPAVCAALAALKRGRELAGATWPNIDVRMREYAPAVSPHQC